MKSRKFRQAARNGTRKGRIDMSERNQESRCPCCGRHCPAEMPGCERGQAYFSGRSDTPREAHGGHERAGGHGRRGLNGHGRMHERHGFPGGPFHQDASPEGRVLGALRGCGHYLHHSAGADADAGALLSFLSAVEKEQLASLLEKCLAHWQK